MITQHATLSSACASGQQGIVELLCSLEETDLDALDSDGTSPLCAAVTWDFEGIVRVLIDAGCDVNVKNHGTSTTALHVAAINENGKMAHMLLQAGADPTLQDVFGRAQNLDDECTVRIFFRNVTTADPEPYLEAQMAALLAFWAPQLEGHRWSRRALALAVTIQYAQSILGSPRLCQSCCTAQHCEIGVKSVRDRCRVLLFLLIFWHCHPM